MWKGHSDACFKLPLSPSTHDFAVQSDPFCSSPTTSSLTCKVATQSDPIPFPPTASSSTQTPSTLPAFVDLPQLSRVYRCHYRHSSTSQRHRTFPQRSSAGPTMSLHHFRLLFPPLLPATLAAFVLRRLTPLGLCANVIAVHIASLENPEIETHLFPLIPSPILSLYLPFHLLLFRKNPIHVL